RAFRWSFLQQHHVVNLADDVLEVVIGRVFPADQVTVRDQPARGLVAVGIDHRLVGLPGHPLVDPGHQGRLGEDAAVPEVVVGNPEAERLIAGVEAGLRALLQRRRRQVLAGFQVVVGVLERLGPQGRLPWLATVRGRQIPAAAIAGRQAQGLRITIGYSGNLGGLYVFVLYSIAGLE